LINLQTVIRQDLMHPPQTTFLLRRFRRNSASPPGRWRIPGSAWRRPRWPPWKPRSEPVRTNRVWRAGNCTMAIN